MGVGTLTASQLKTVQGDMALAKDTAARYLLLKAAAKKKLGRSISIAGPAGAFRSAVVQHAMHVAGAGHNAAAKERWGLNPYSTVAIADHPYGTHEDGHRVDIVGTPMDTAFLNLAAKYGFKLEFPGRDPNHFVDRKTYKLTVPAKVKAATVSKKVYVTIKSGDTLLEIAASHKTTLPKILSLNPSIKNADVIKLGQKIRVK